MDNDVYDEFYSVGEMIDSIASTTRGIRFALDLIERTSPGIFEREDEDNEYLTPQQAPAAHSYVVLSSMAEFLPEMASVMVSALRAHRGEIDLRDINDIYYDDVESEEE
jgi:hypothetical protein